MTHFEKYFVHVYVCIHECGSAYARTCVEVSVGSFSTLFETYAIVIVLYARLACRFPEIFPFLPPVLQ